MKYIKFLVVGIFFGIVLTKAEAVSWFRIYEMFHFESFHMFGIIGVAVVTGVLGIQIIKRLQLRSIEGNKIEILDKEPGFVRYVVGGIFFGLGWGMVGACPGPIFILLGAGFWHVIFVFIGALLGTFVYGVLQNKLPH